jgi:hypothetical protein
MDALAVESGGMGTPGSRTPKFRVRELGLENLQLFFERTVADTKTAALSQRALAGPRRRKRIAANSKNPRPRQQLPKKQGVTTGAPPPTAVRPNGIPP